MTEPKPIAIRLDAELLARLDAAAEQISKKAHGAPVSRSAVIRLAIEKGLPLLLKK